MLTALRLLSVQDYTGAPFYAGMAILRAGADLSYVLTAEEAAAAIKSYSPELMVTPVYSSKALDSADNAGAARLAESMATEVVSRIPRLHSLVIGPGLGRDERVFSGVRKVISAAREKGVYLVLDADALFLISQEPDLIRGYRKAVLTPNIVEFDRLWKGAGRPPRSSRSQDAVVADVQGLAESLGNVVVILKGEEDVLSDGKEWIVSSTQGGLKRCGGIWACPKP